LKSKEWWKERETTGSWIALGSY